MALKQNDYSRNMSVKASHVTSNSIVCSGRVHANQKDTIKDVNYRPFVREIHRWPVESLKKGQWCWKSFHMLTLSRFFVL